MLVGVMLLSLVMSSALPRAYGERGLWVAGAYAAMQVGRATFAVVALGGQPGLRRNFQRILSWKVPPAVLWLAGGFVHGSARLALWIVAVAIEYVAPAAGFRTPWLGRSTPADWPISGRQLAERSQLFILIALGESILVTGAVFGARPPDAVELAALVVAFLGTIALWWIYFDRSAEAASSVIDEAGDPGRLGRSAYTYHHLPMVAGIIVAAVGDELTINHPTGHSSGVTIAAVLGGPALFLAGHALFKRAVFRRYSLPRVVALGLLAALVPVGLVVPPVALSALATLVVAGVAAWDRWVIARREAA
jgi:low temperature requirement protein LtrA